MRTRRNFLQAASLAASAAYLNSLGMARFAFGQTPGGKTFVKIFARGGIDGLHLFPLVGDDNYYLVRPNIAVPRPSDTDIDAAIDMGLPMRAMNPNLYPLMELWDAGKLLVSPSTSSPDLNQSHFDSQRWIGTGTRNNLIDGYLNRYLQQRQGVDHPIRGASLGKSDISREMIGSIPTPTINSQSAFDIRNGDFCSGSGCSENRLLERIDENAHHPTDLNAVEGRLKESQILMIETIREVQALGAYVPSASALEISPGGYSNSSTGRGLQLIAQLLKGGVPLEVAAINFSGPWDSHNDQISRSQSQPITDQTFGYNRTMAQGALDLAVFVRDMGEMMQDVVLLFCTEFGRTVRENGSLGTDHARGAAWMMLGGDVQGGMLGDVAELTDQYLVGGSKNHLPTIVDYKDLCGEILVKHLGLDENLVSVVFPGHSWTDHGVIGSGV